MKRIEDILNMDAEALEAAALQENVPAPEGLKERIETKIAAKTIADETSPKPDPKAKKPVFKPAGKRFKRLLPYVGIAAAVLLVVLFTHDRDKEPIDTFEDPAMAYAQVEDVFKQISDKMSHGIEMAADATTNNNDYILSK